MLETGFYRVLMNRTFVAVLCAFFLSASFQVDRAMPQDLVAKVAAAYETAKSQFDSGSFSGKVKSSFGTAIIKKCRWMGKSSFVEVEIQLNKDPTAQTSKEVQLNSSQVILSNDKFLVVWSKSQPLSLAAQYPIGVADIDPMAKVAPMDRWFLFEDSRDFIPQMFYFKTPIPNCTVTAKESEHTIEIDVDVRDAVIQSYVADGNHGWLLTSYETKAKAGRPAPKIIRKGSFEWKQDKKGRNRLGSMRWSRQIGESKAEPYFFELSIDEWDDDYIPSEEEFTIESLRLPKGTKFVTYDRNLSVTKSEVIGMTKNELREKRLRELAEEMKKSGFSKPEKN